jgi:hypothetical protein
MGAHSSQRASDERETRRFCADLIRSALTFDLLDLIDALDDLLSNTSASLPGQSTVRHTNGTLSNPIQLTCRV